jgi:GcrA cell cycle regulator
MPLEWNADELATLHSMWRAGETGAAIAEKLGTSRSAVLGKIARIGLIRKQTKRKPRRSTKPKFPFLARIKRAPRAPRTPPPQPSGPVHFADLAEHHCRWIPGEPHTQMYCGATKISGSSYCATHTRIAWARTAAKAVA